MHFEFVYLILGLLVLWLGAKLVINGSLSIAKHFKISHMFIGLTILAIGTDLPELFIDIVAAISRLQGVDTSGLIVGETIGTCMAQIGLALGIISLLGVSTVKKRELFRDGLMMLGSVVILFVASLDGKLTAVEGIIFMVIYSFYFITILREEKLFEKIKKNNQGLYTLSWAFVSLIGGIIFLIFASKLVIDSAVELAVIWGVSQSIIGILIIGLGTSLPEISVAISALFKKVPELSIGNILGSNIFDALFTIGAGASIAGFNVSRDLLKWDFPILFFVSLLVLFFLRTRMKLDKREAFILIGIYIAYFIFKLVTMK